MCTRKDTLAHILGVPCLDDVMNYNSFTTIQYIVIGNKYSMLDENLKPNIGKVGSQLEISHRGEYLKSVT